MPALAREPDRKRFVAVLAEQFHATADNVAVLFERERADLARGARVTTFIDIFAVRKVEDVLRSRARDESAAPARTAALSSG
jgi:hypothetical protein